MASDGQGRMTWWDAVVTTITHPVATINSIVGDDTSSVSLADTPQSVWSNVARGKLSESQVDDIVSAVRDDVADAGGDESEQDAAEEEIRGFIDKYHGGTGDLNTPYGTGDLVALALIVVGGVLIFNAISGN